MPFPDNTELERQGGRVNYELGQLVTENDVERMGEMAIQTLTHLFMLLFYDSDNAIPLSGFPRTDALLSTQCEATATGDLAFSVAPGIGFFFDVTKLDPSGDPFESQAYQPIVVDVPTSGALAAHDATDPRIDILTLAPARFEDENATRNIKNPVTGALSTQGVDQRNRFFFTLTVTTGTPAPAPVQPSTPAGNILISVASVPATSGASVFRDARPVVELGSFFKGQPSELYTLDFVPQGANDELEVVANSPVALNVVGKLGRAVSGGLSRFYPREVLTIATADPTDPPIDPVEARRDGLLNVVTGTPAPTPVAPAKTAGAVRLATVDVGATVTTITSPDITDVRPRTPHSGSFLRDATITNEKIADAEIQQAKFDIQAETRHFNYHCAGWSFDPDDTNNTTGAELDPQPQDAGVRPTTSAVVASWTQRTPAFLPDGATVTALDFSFNILDATAVATCSLIRISPTGSVVVMATAAYSTGTGDFTITDSTITSPVIDNSGFAYMLTARAERNIAQSSADVFLRSARITVDTTQILS